LRPRRSPVGIAFLTVWLVLWAAMMLVVLYAAGAAALRGEFAATPVLLLWFAVAGFGFWKGVERLSRMLVDPPRRTRPPRAGRWHDDMPPPPSDR
jgi:hypothetical protein